MQWADCEVKFIRWNIIDIGILIFMIQVFDNFGKTCVDY